MKAIFILGFAFGLFAPINAQNTLSGTVTDLETGESLIGANLYLPDLQKGTSTDSSGYYRLTGLPNGTFTLEISHLGYGNRVTKVTLRGDQTHDIVLSQSITEIGEVVITGTSASTERKLNPVPTRVLANLTSGEQSATNLIDALAGVPGISQITTGAAISKPVIRGLGFNRVVVINNHIRQEGQQWGDEHGIEIDQFSVDRVEIIKGPGSLRYGSDAMAGVLHFLPPKPLEEGQVRAEVLGNYQSNNGLIAGSIMNQGNLNGWQWLVRASGKQAGNYQNPIDGRVYNSAFREWNGNASLGINRKWGYAKITASSFNQRLGLVEGERDSLGRFLKLEAVNDTTVEEVPATSEDLRSYAIHPPSQWINHLRIGSNNKFFFGNSSMAVNLAFQQNRRQELHNPLDPTEAELYFILNTFNYDLHYALPALKGWETSVGINGMQQTSRNKGEEFLIPAYQLFDIGVFGITQKSFEGWHISGGLRYDYRSIDAEPLYLNANEEPVDDPSQGETKFEAFQTNLYNWSASLGASYSITDDLIAKANISRGFRAPNLSELGSNGTHEGTFRYEIGNSNLQAETSRQADVGLLFNTDHVSLEVSAFHNSIGNYIYLTKLTASDGTDSIVDPDEPDPAYQYTQGQAQLYGGEVIIDIHPHPLDWLHFENSLSFVRGIRPNQPDNLQNLPFIPAPRFTSELRADFQRVGKRLKKMFIKLEVAHTFAQPHAFTAYGTETPTPAYTLLNAAIGAAVVSKNGNTLFRVAIAGSNLLDVGYQHHLSRLKYAPENPDNGRMGVFNMGRNISMQLTVPLELVKPK